MARCQPSLGNNKVKKNEGATNKVNTTINVSKPTEPNNTNGQT